MTFLLLLAAGLLASLLTLGIAAVLFHVILRERLQRTADARLTEIAAHIRAQVKAGVIEGIDEADISEDLDAVQARVQAGVQDGVASNEVKEVLDDYADHLERRVRKGVTDAITALPHPDVIRDATRNATEVGSSLLAEGLNTLLGSRPRPKPDDRP